MHRTFTELHKSFHTDAVTSTEEESLYSNQLGFSLLSTADAAEYLGIRPQSIQKMVKTGKLAPVYKSGRVIVFSRHDVDRVSKSHRDQEISDETVVWIPPLSARKTLEWIKEEVGAGNSTTGYSQIELFADHADSYLAGYATFAIGNERGYLVPLVMPTCVAILGNGRKYFTDALATGYRGTGPSYARDLLKDADKEGDAPDLSKAEIVTAVRQESGTWKTHTAKSLFDGRQPLQAFKLFQNIRSGNDIAVLSAKVLASKPEEVLLFLSQFVDNPSVLRVILEQRSAYLRGIVAPVNRRASRSWISGSTAELRPCQLVLQGKNRREVWFQPAKWSERLDRAELSTVNNLIRFLWNGTFEHSLQDLDDRVTSLGIDDWLSKGLSVRTS